VPGAGDRDAEHAPVPDDAFGVPCLVEEPVAALGTNWSLHDIRHTTCARMSADPGLTLPEIQTVMRHAQLSTTQRYMTPRLDELIGKLQAHYQRPAPPLVPASGYDPDDLATVFGG
jgi:hypothetical protein